MLSAVTDLVAAETVHNLYAVSIWGLVLAGGLVWVTLNVYQYYPLFQTLMMDAAEDATDTVDAPSIRDNGYPEIDVFVPAFDRADVIEQSLASIGDTAYPHRKLNVYVLTDPDEGATRAALERLRDEYPFTELAVPGDYPGEPSEPRALNYAFDVTTSELVAIVDAADRVGERFFEQAAGTLVETDCSYALGRLDVAAGGDGWLHEQLRAGDATWHGVLLPAFHRLDYPVPLAGTPRVFTRDVLQRVASDRTRRFGDPWPDAAWDWLADHALVLDGVKPWDPTGVAEDFELGLLLWALDEECRYLGAVTKEATTQTGHTWLRQRLRRQRGTLSTLVRYLGRPPTGHGKTFHLFGQAGRPYLGAINLVGLLGFVSLSYLVGYQPPRAISTLLLAGALYAVFAMLLAGYCYGYFSEGRHPQRARRALVVFVTRPVFWLLQLMADVRTFVRVWGRRFTLAETDPEDSAERSDSS